MSTLVELTAESWDDFVRAGTALAGFWAPWSVPSQSLEPLLEAVAQDFTGRLRVGIANHDHSPALAERYRIQGLPTLLVFQGGAEVRRRVGLMDRAGVHALVREVIG
ncbi:MAG TPA: thioredoxin domain-containing protein [Vicinamibacteria bacterium]|nr:thioredoxin domain-containing protein [Vicinamibacteria bacterium]